MKIMNYMKKTLWGVFAAGIILGTSVQVYCTEDWYNDTNVEEHISKVEGQLKSAGYTLNRTMDNGNSGQPAATDATAPKQESNKAIISCEHAYVDSIAKEPTCADPGMMESKCSKCGDTYKTEIPATGRHEYSSEVTKEATCTDKGVTTFTCNVCGDSYTEEIPIIDHTFESSIAEDASCTTAGTRVFICSQCGDSYTIEIPAKGHSEEEEITREAGAFTSGEKSVICSVCGETISTEVIPSRYPSWYLYIAVASLILLLIAVILIGLRKKHIAVDYWKKSA